MNKGLFSRAIQATTLLGEGITDGARGAWLTAKGGVGSATDGFRALGGARFREAAQQARASVTQLGVQMPVDAILMVGGRAVSFAQTLLGLEEPGRPLDLDEFVDLQTVFGKALAYERVLIKTGASGVGEFSGDRAFVHGNTVYMKRTPPALWSQILVHEMVHVWQHQTFGTSYLSACLWAQRLGHEAYNWRPHADRGVEWTALGPEQQAAAIEDAYMQGFFRTNRCKMGNKDYSDYMNQMREAVLAGGPRHSK